MNFLELVEESITVLRVNKLRTVLSALGIIIGIGSVITLMTLGSASQSQISTQIQSLGTNLLTISPGARQSGFLRGAGSNETTLKYDDAKAIIESKQINTVAKVAAVYTARSQVSVNRNNTNTTINGVSGEDFFTMRNIKAAIGTTITNSNNINLEKVIVLGNTVYKDLFENDTKSPIGQFVRVNGQSFKIIGVLESKSSGPGSSFDDGVYIPLFVAQKAVFGVQHVSTIYAEAKSSDQMDAALNQIGFLLLSRHKIDLPENADFNIFSQADLLETISSVTQTFTALLAGIASISLIVGGIGIMNIMLVSVTERTTEIGLRKALGAKRKAIVTQFLIEAVVLTVVGGLIGVIIGLTMSYIITSLLSLPTTFSYPSIVLAVGVSCITGIIFGWYPAYKASKLQPIEALRYE